MGSDVTCQMGKTYELVQFPHRLVTCARPVRFSHASIRWTADLGVRSSGTRTQTWPGPSHKFMSVASLTGSFFMGGTHGEVPSSAYTAANENKNQELPLGRCLQGSGLFRLPLVLGIAPPTPLRAVGKLHEKTGQFPVLGSWIHVRGRLTG